MTETAYHTDLSRCVRCGACKTLCPTFLTTLNETMGARGRVTLLGELEGDRLSASKNLAEKIFSCMLCEACRNLCPVGINIPEVVYQGRTRLKDSFTKGVLLRTALKYSAARMDTAFSLLRWVQKAIYKPLFHNALLSGMPEIASEPFKNSFQVYRKKKKASRIAIFAGCSVNYFYPGLGIALSRILLSKGYEVVVFRGELCCGAPLRSAGLVDEAVTLAQKNIEHFSKVRAEAIISMCPTCTMVIRDQYPQLAGGTITNLMDIHQFLLTHNIVSGLEINPSVMTYHDPCHLNYGMNIQNEPRQILKGIKGVEFTEMKHAHECCGFAGLFSMHFRSISRDIGKKKIENILDTNADTVVTSCPGCVMQLENLKKTSKAQVNVRHIIEVIDEAMNPAVK
ncbi:MAG: (Fe-S)-binding protein [Nitrospiraceae bacterium]|nr:MAG: (Fe-S)-binding protein [Nitrospiraceae bacterium]